VRHFATYGEPLVSRGAGPDQVIVSFRDEVPVPSTAPPPQEAARTALAATTDNTLFPGLAAVAACRGVS
jgi:hypothetical protein